MQTVKQIKHSFKVKSEAQVRKIAYFTERVSSIADVSTAQGKRAMTLANKCLRRHKRELEALNAKYKIQLAEFN
jgi:ribosomal protein L2